MALAGGAGLELKTCWSEIGVYGDGTCAELRKFVHCRNCAVYSTAGAQLLNRAPPPDYRRERTEQFAAKRSFAKPGNTSAVLFRIEADWLALPTSVFQEIAERRLIHSLPHRRQGIALGLANVRGELLLCMSLGHLLGLAKLPSLEALRVAYSRLLVVNWDGYRFAFPVDQVHGPHRFHQQETKAAPATVARSQPSFIQNFLCWQDRAVGLLEADLVFSALNRNLA